MNDLELNNIIDCLNPAWTPLTDEYIVQDSDESGLFTRSFKNRDEGAYALFWRVYYGTPETVKTVFEDIQRIQ